MATVEDILPESRPVPSKIALILSESTERWDFAGIARDRAAVNFYEDYKKARLAYHQERVGIYYTLVHNSHPPDLLLEEDVQKGRLKDYSVAYWIGDCIERPTLRALQEWVEAGGHLVATAGAFRFDEYHRPLPEGLSLLGLQKATLEVQEWFFRPQIELPCLVPLDWMDKMPALAMRDNVTTGPDTTVLASFKSGKPAVAEHAAGKGKVSFVATLPGVAYLWSAYQPDPANPPLVPSRGPSSHLQLVNFNEEARRLIIAAPKDVTSHVEAHGAWLDARLLQSAKGYAIPLANYSADVQTPVTLTLRGMKNVRKVTSASHGELKTERAEDGAVTVHYVPGIGDILRIDP